MTNWSRLLNLVFVFCFSLIVILPTGYVFGFPIKHVLLLFLLFFYFFSGTSNLSFFSRFSFVLLLVVLPFLFLGVSSFGALSLRESQMIMVPLILSALFVAHFGDDSFSYLLAFILYSSVLAFFLKLLFIALVFLEYYTMEAVVNLHESIFASGFITMQIYPDIIRVFMPFDAFFAFLPFMIGLILMASDLRPGRSYLFLVLAFSFFIIFFSYSRFLWFVYLFGGVFLFFSITGSVRKFTLASSVLIVLLLVIFLGADFLTERFSAKHNVSSDSIRLEQFFCLVDLWLQRPFWGWGLGAYSPECIRSASEPYSYELQVFSFLPKLGIFFFIFLSAYIGWVCYHFFHERILFALFLMLVLLAGLTNPALFNTGFIPVFILMILMSSRFRALQTCIEV